MINKTRIKETSILMINKTRIKKTTTIKITTIKITMIKITKIKITVAKIIKKSHMNRIPKIIAIKISILNKRLKSVFGSVTKKITKV